MTAAAGRVLVVDDDQAMCDLLAQGLGRHGFEVESVRSGQDALDRLAASDYDVVVTDLRMGGMGGLELCERVIAARPGLPVIVMTAFGSMDTAIAAMRAGAYDFVTKPFDIELVSIALARAVGYQRLRDDLRRLQEAAGRGDAYAEIIGTSPPMGRLFSLLDRVKDSDVTVLITGESGTGKELVARALHESGTRKDGPFVAVNCAAVPEQLLESELFGHARGAFTDARASRGGLFVRAHGGTLFLDEIGEMAAGMQAKLLRALQDKVVRPVGSDEEVTFDARVLAATNRDLLQAVEDGRFRQDLYFRLNVLEIAVPPLRSRGSDVLLLAQRFLADSARQAGKQVRGISPEAARKLLDYRWPGNVRELHNCMQRAVALARFDQLTVDDLPDRVRDYRGSHVLVAAEDPAELVTLEELERRYVLRVLDAVSGHRSEAARILGLDRKTLYRKLERWGERDGGGDGSPK